MSDGIKANLNPYLGRIGVKQIADNFAKNYKPKNKDELKEVSKNFEAMFVQMMLKAMRKTIPKSSFSLQGLENDIYTSMLDEKISDNVAKRGTIGISDFIYNQMGRMLHQKDSVPLHNSRLKPLKKSDKLIPLGKEGKLIPLEKESKKIPLKETDIKIPLKKEGVLQKRINSYDLIINEAAKKNNIDPSLIKAVIAQESSGRENAVSSSGAKGLMQLKDITAREVGVNDVFNPAENIHGGTEYLKKMLDNNNGDVTLALASYNAGPGNVRRFGGIPPFKETRDYIGKVLGFYEMFKQEDTRLKLT